VLVKKTAFFAGMVPVSKNKSDSGEKSGASQKSKCIDPLNI
jgi:hypothetical protein